MASAKGRLLGALGGLVLTEGAVASVEAIGGFRAIRIAGPGLRGARWRPGDKVQVLLPSRDVRTFTPIGWDAAAGATELLVQVGDPASPAGRWASGLRAGDPIRFVGPQRSLAVPAAGAIVLYGDETSLGLARALVAARGAADVALVLELGPEAAASLPALGLPGAVAIARGAAADAAREIADALARSPGAALLMTGNARAIQAVRAALPSGVRARATRAYWAPGKVGLD